MRKYLKENNEEFSNLESDIADILSGYQDYFDIYGDIECDMSTPKNLENPTIVQIHYILFGDIYLSPMYIDNTDALEGYYKQVDNHIKNSQKIMWDQRESELRSMGITSPEDITEDNLGHDTPGSILREYLEILNYDEDFTWDAAFRVTVSYEEESDTWLVKSFYDFSDDKGAFTVEGEDLIVGNNLKQIEQAINSCYEKY